jgi:hypothetical protein
MAGLEGRCNLLIRLGSAIEARPDICATGRPGDILGRSIRFDPEPVFQRLYQSLNVARCPTTPPWEVEHADTSSRLLLHPACPPLRPCPSPSSGPPSSPSSSPSGHPAPPSPPTPASPSATSGPVHHSRVRSMRRALNGKRGTTSCRSISLRSGCAIPSSRLLKVRRGGKLSVDGVKRVFQRCARRSHDPTILLILTRLRVANG